MNKVVVGAVVACNGEDGEDLDGNFANSLTIGEIQRFHNYDKEVIVGNIVDITLDPRSKSKSRDTDVCLRLPVESVLVLGEAYPENLVYRSLYPKR